MVISEFESHTTTKNRIMKVTCKITGKDMTSWLLNKWKNEYKDKQIEKLMTKDLSRKEFDKKLNKICQEK